jgi:hypothetical protein
MRPYYSKEASNLNSIKEFNEPQRNIFVFVKKSIKAVIEVKSNGYLLQKHNKKITFEICCLIS